MLVPTRARRRYDPRADTSTPVAVAQRLEPRVMLAGNVVISEFLAVNNGGIADRDGDRSDWIELHNPTDTNVSLAGHFLTDDRSDLTRWPIPAVTIPPGGHLVVFASGKDLRVAGQELHTNFSLDGAGDDLLLVGPGGTLDDVLTAFTPFPQQLADVSFGTAVVEIITPLVGPSAPVRVLVPGNGALGTGWTARTFDDAQWVPGRTGVGYDTVSPPPPVAGFTLKMVDLAPGGADTVIDGLPEAAALLDGTADPARYNILFNGQASPVPLINHGSGGAFGSDRVLPNGFGPANSNTVAEREQYALRATANLVIPGGDWTVNVNSDDGFRLRVPGVTFITRTNENTTGVGASPPDTLVFAPARGVGNTFATFSVPPEGLTTSLQLDAYERTGGDSLELSVAGGHQSAFGTATFSLLANGTHGWSVTTSPPPPPDYRPLLGTDLLAAMKDVNASAYVRVPFTVDEADGFETLRLRMKYDDGFLAYLNGTEVARRNAPATPAWNSAAASSRADASALLFEDINVALPLLREGENVLSVHGLNDGPGGDDFLVQPELQGVVTLENAERYFNPPTPGARNSASDLAEVVGDTRFSVDRGFFDEPFDVGITNDTPGATIRYTTDGSPPTATTGVAYTGPVRVSTTTVLRAAAFKPGAIASNVDTQTYIFLNDVIRQPAAPAGFPTPGSPGMHWSYEMDPLVVNNPAYSGTIVNDLKSIPSLSLVMKNEDLFGANGLYMNPGASGLAWERPGSAELIYADGTKEGFQIDAGVRIYGGVSRSVNYPKHTFRLLFKNQYGAGKLKYPLFEGMPGAEGATDEFDTIILRGNFNKSWPFGDGSQRAMAQYLHDQFLATTQLALGQPAIHGTFVHLYVNGLYWGLYNPVERPSAPFAASYLGGEKEDYDALNSSEPVDGVKTAWTALQNIANGIAAGQPWTAANPNPDALATPEAYAAIKEYLDVDNLSDYFILNIFGGNQDWDDHNWYAARKREPGAGYKFFSWDGERTLESLTHNKSTVNQADKPSRLYAQLRANPEFRLLFADHIHRHMFNDGALTPAANQARYAALAAVIDRAIVGESARWGDDKRPGQPYTRDLEWVAERDRILNVYFPNRPGNVMSQFRALGLYPDVAAPVFAQHGGDVAEGFALAMSDPNGSGTIYFTLDGSDPRLPGGGISPAAVGYNGTAVPLTQNTVAKARVLLNGAWSALNAATFSFNMAALRVTEVMYHPAPPPAGSPFAAGDFEFIELQNTGPRPLFVGGVRLRDAVEFTFGTLTLAPGQRTVVVANVAAFQSRYGAGVPVAGTFGGSLSDGGDHVRLESPRGQTILDFDYRDGWYSQTDGEGYSLVVINPQGNPLSWDEKQSWRPGNELHGGPGAADPGLNPFSVVVNEVLANAAAPGGDFVELHNNTNDPIDLSGWFLSNAAADPRRFRVPAGTTLAPSGFVVFHEAALGLSLSEIGGDVFLASVDSRGNLGGYRDAARFTGSFPGTSFGLHLRNGGGTDFIARLAPTPGAANAPPLIGPVVISEVMYNPPPGGTEYVELHNITGDAVPLYEPADPARRWRFAEGINFTLPAGATIPAFGFALVVPIDPSLFRSRHALPPGALIFGPYQAADGSNLLDNGGEDLALVRPGPGGGEALVDRLDYRDALPWPTAADGTGPSLSRLAAFEYGNDPFNWDVDLAVKTPGRRNFDFVAPIADVVDVVPDPRNEQVVSVDVQFDEPVTGLELSSLRLSRDGGPDLLTASQTLATADGMTWTVGNLASLTATPGTYVLTVVAGGSGIADYARNALGSGASDTWRLAAGAAVVGRRVFYNNSAADRGVAVASAGDDAAIAADKTALLPGATASFANYTSYFLGLNGVMIDVAGLPASFEPAAADFTFRAGPGGNPAGWALAPAPLSITRRNGAGANGSDRITLTWADGAVRNKWLQVTLAAGPRTALAAADVFYFANLVGETGNAAGVPTVNAMDVARTRAALGTRDPATIARHDFNRDGRVNVTDVTIVRANQSRTLAAAAPPAAVMQATRLSAAGTRAAAPRRLWYEVDDSPLV